LGEASRRYLLRTTPAPLRFWFRCVSRSRHDHVTSAGSSTQNRGSVGIILPRCVVGPRSDLPESQSQSRICARCSSIRNGPDLRLYSVVLQHASLARVSSDVTGRLSQLCRAGSPAAAATQPSRPRRPPLAPGACQLPAPHQSPRGRTYAPTRPQYKRFESTLSSARRSRSQEALAQTPRPKTTPQRARLRWPQHRAEQWLQTQRGWCCSVSAPLAPPRAGRPTG
jgi:hypothetical protein